MNYRDHFKRLAAHETDESLIPEGVDPEEFEMGVKDERGEHDGSDALANKLTRDHLTKDPHYYSKLKGAGLEQDECATCGCGDPTDDHSDEDPGNEYDDNGGLPKIGGALAIPHLGDPIRMSKIISVGPIGDGPANGELSGYSNVGGSSGKGVTKDQGGIEAKQEGDKEPITAGGHKPDNLIAAKSVGGSVVPGEGQKQGGKNTVGTIADTAKLDEGKQKVRKIVKEVLKEITFDKKSGKWVRLTEGGHKAGCKCGFCKNKGTFGKKKKEDKSEEMDETVDMKMGPSYKTVQSRMYDVQTDDRARTNQYDPEITEMYDEEEECMAEQRYTELVNAQRNLNETEIAEMGSLREKIEKMALAKRNYGLSQGGVEPNQFEEGRCEDFPCCGHEQGDCPSRDSQGNEVWKCAGCGGKLPKNSRSSLCPRRIQRVHGASEDPTGQDMDNLSGGGYQQQNELSTGGNGKGFKPMGRFKPTGRYAENKVVPPMTGNPPLEEYDENTVNMKMGPSYKKVQQVQYQDSGDDHARNNQFDPEMTEGGEPNGDMQLSEEEIQSLMKEEPGMNAGGDDTQPQPQKQPQQPQPQQQPPEKQNGFMAALSTIDAQGAKELYTALRNSLTKRELQTRAGVEAAQQLMRAILKKFPALAQGQGQPQNQGQVAQGQVKEAGIGAVQHSSYRVLGQPDHGNHPQDPKTRWADDLDEVTKKVSKAVKAIQKGQTGKKTKKNPKLKFQPTKHTTSGVHKRKT